MFDKLLEKTGFDPEEILIVDDSEETVKVANGLGFRDVLFEGVKELKNELNKQL